MRLNGNRQATIDKHWKQESSEEAGAALLFFASDYA
jgi:hypothetical protein